MNYYDELMSYVKLSNCVLSNLALKTKTCVLSLTSACLLSFASWPQRQERFRNTVSFASSYVDI